MFSDSYPYLPLWLLTLLFFLLLMAAQQVGMYVRRRQDLAARASAARPDKTEGEDKEHDGFAVNSVLGLLALLIGFTFSLALGRYDSRRELVVQEANALGTTWLRTDLLSPEDRGRAQEVLRRYVDGRVAFGNARNTKEELARYHDTEVLQNELWNVMIQATAPFKDSPRASLVITTTNESIDLAAERLATREAHIPPRILRLLLLFAVLTAALVGYVRVHQPKASALLLLLFTLAVGLVMDLDRPTSGMINVPQQPMLDLQRSLQAASPAPPAATSPSPS